MRFHFICLKSSESNPVLSDKAPESRAFWKTLTFGHIHGIQAADEVSDVQSIPILLAQPVVAGEVKPEVRSVHVGHDHAVKEPARVQSGVIVLNPRGRTIPDLIF